LRTSVSPVKTKRNDFCYHGSQIVYEKHLWSLTGDIIVGFYFRQQSGKL